MIFVVLAWSVIGIANAGGLWVPNANVLSEYEGKLKNGAVNARRVNSSIDVDGANGIAFDTAGNMWVTDFFSNSIIEFTRAQTLGLKKNPSPNAVAVISEDNNGVLDGPEGLAFQNNGNMWVGAERSGTILVYTPDQIASSGNPIAGMTLGASSFTFDSPSNVLFDQAGNLWVVDEEIDNGNGGKGAIFKYTPAQLAGMQAGVNKIDPVFGIGAAQFGHLEGLAFDRNGNAWLADGLNNSIYQYAADQISGAGLFKDVAPAVVLTRVSMDGPCTLSIDSPYGVAVDRQGNLFVANDGDTGTSCSGSLAQFSAKSITASGSPKPVGFISSNVARTNVDAPGYLTFGPSIP